MSERGCPTAHLEADLPLLEVVVRLIVVLRRENRVGHGYLTLEHCKGGAPRCRDAFGRTPGTPHSDQQD